MKTRRKSIKYQQKIVKVCTLEFKGTVLRMCSDQKDLRRCSIAKRLATWQKKDLNPIQWGWRTVNGLGPTGTNTRPVPLNILKKIFCSCKKGCSGACGY